MGWGVIMYIHLKRYVYAVDVKFVKFFKSYMVEGLAYMSFVKSFLCSLEIISK